MDSDAAYVPMDDLRHTQLNDPLMGDTPSYFEPPSLWTRTKHYIRTVFQSEDWTWTGRLVDRTAPFQQSRGRVRIHRMVPTFFKHFVHSRDWFHSILNKPTHVVLLIIFSAYLIVITVWTGFWWAIHDRCNLNFATYTEAFYLSIETVSTIGYGVPDVYFGGCHEAFFVIVTEYFLALCLDACCIGLIFSRISRPFRRSRSLCFSGKAVMASIRGQYHFLFQIVETRKHQPVEAHVRCYAIRHVKNKRGQIAYFQSQYMRIQHPNDELGGMLILNLPCLVTHRIDAWSPLFPPRTGPRVPGEGISNSFRYPEVFQRAMDYDVGNRGVAEYDTEPRTEDAIKQGAAMGLLPGGSVRLDPEAVRQYWRDSKMEIVIIFEGIDAVSSSSFQKRHSYTVDDIEWDRMFVPMVSENADGECVVDYSKLHTTVPMTDLDEDDIAPVVSVM